MSKGSTEGYVDPTTSSGLMKRAPTSPDPIAEAVAAELALLSSRAIVGETDPNNNYRVLAPPPCEACGGPAHGPINELIACLTQHMRTARSQQGGREQAATTMCKGCGQAHRTLDQVVACLERELTKARAELQQRVGVTMEEFRQNQAQSKHFEATRGKLKRGGGG
jgi:hypothetical protein